MRKKFTMLLAALFAFVGVAKADFTQKWEKTTVWQTEGFTTPQGVTDVAGSFAVALMETQVEVAATTIGLTFDWGNIGSCALQVLGVELVAEDGTLIKLHYGKQAAGGSTDAIYSLTDLTVGTSGTLRYYVGYGSNDRLNDTGGNITITGATLALKSAVTVTTNPAEPVLYTIKNVRGNVYATFDGAGTAIKLRPSIADAGYLFYFTEGTAKGTYKIHSYVNNKKCAAVGSWNEEGIDWYILPSGTGWAISKEATLTDDGSEAWNDYQNAHHKVDWYGGNDAGSVWAIEAFDQAVPVVKMSTNEAKHLYYIANDRSNDKSNKNNIYVHYVAAGTQFSQSAGVSSGSYWYFVDATADLPVGTVVPEGTYVCRIYNAANDLAVENPSNGNMTENSGVTYPAKIYYLRPHENTYWGYGIYPYDEEGAGWNNASDEGSVVGCWDYNDWCSIWSILPADKTEAQLKSEAATAKTNALNTIASYEYADYYTYADDAIATAKAEVEALDVNALTTAVNAPATINAAMAELQATEKNGAPAVGQYIQLKNKQYAKFLKANDDNLTSSEDSNDLRTIWFVETGKEEGQVRLKNMATEEYIGEIRDSKTVPMTTVDNEHNNFTWSNPTGVYAAFKETSSGNRGYGHINGSNVLVGWENAANATQWAITEFSVEDAKALLQVALDYTNIYVGTEPGQYTISDEAFTTLKANAQSLIDDESTDIPALCAAVQSLRNYDFAANGTMNLPQVGQYYHIECPLFYNVQGVKKALWSNGTQVRWKTLDENDKSFYWTVEATETGFALKNCNDNKYVLGKENNRTSWTMEETATGADYTIEAAGQGQVFIKIATRHLHANNHNEGQASDGDIVSWETNQYNSASAWQFVSTVNPDWKFAKEELDEYLEYFYGAYYDSWNEKWRDQKGVNNYTIVVEKEPEYKAEPLEVLYNNAKVVADAAAEKTADELVDARQILEGWEEYLVINQPEAGKFYRIRNTSNNNYLKSTTDNDGKLTISGGTGDVAIFYYKDNALLSYTQGLYMNDRKFNLEGVTSDVVFSEATNGDRGCYIIEVGEDRYIYGKKASLDSGTPTDGNPENLPKDNGYNWWLEEVTTLPVKVGAAGWGTFYTPVAVTVPNTVEAYTITAVDEKATLTQVEGIVPAGTGLILEGEGTHDFAIATEDAAEDFNKGSLEGAAAKTYVTAAPNTTYYVLAKPEGATDVALYKAKLDKKEGTAFLNGANKVYLPVTTEQGAPAMFAFTRGDEEDTTGIESVEANEELVIFDLAGRRVEKMEKGIYIVNGKKVIK